MYIFTSAPCVLQDAPLEAPLEAPYLKQSTCLLPFLLFTLKCLSMQERWVYWLDKGLKNKGADALWASSHVMYLFTFPTLSSHRKGSDFPPSPLIFKYVISPSSSPVMGKVHGPIPLSFKENNLQGMSVQGNITYFVHAPVKTCEQFMSFQNYSCIFKRAVSFSTPLLDRSTEER